MVIKTVELETVCGITSKFPATDKPEIAFAGKSNVGKSSLINGLMNRKSLAHTSSQPGKTQTINYYNINGAMYLVDLPGYGYTRAPVQEKAKWGKMVERYLHTSRQLRAVFLLVDIRHEPSDNDRQMHDWIVYQGYDPIIIATKSDKVKPGRQQEHLNRIRASLRLKEGTPVLPYSALTKQGREEIWALMDELAGIAAPGQDGVPKDKRASGHEARENGHAHDVEAGRASSGRPDAGGPHGLGTDFEPGNLPGGGTHAAGARQDPASAETKKERKPRWPKERKKAAARKTGKKPGGKAARKK